MNREPDDFDRWLLTWEGRLWRRFWRELPIARGWLVK
jgi:hypothetical protein